MGSFFIPLRKLTLKETKIKCTKQTVEGCSKCGLDYKNKVPPSIGDNYSGLMIIGDKINKPEWEKKKNFVGRTGEILRSISLRNRVNLGREAILTNATTCFYGKPKDIYSKCCRDNLFKVIQQYKPKMIITLGEIATNSVLNTDTKFKITRLRNHFIPCHEHNCLVYPTFNPTALLYNDYDDDEEDEYGNKNTYKSAKPKEYTFQKDMERVLKFWKDKGHNRKTIDRILRERNILEGIEIKEIKTKRELDQVVKLIHETGRFSFDYETSNTKPYDDNFKVWLWSFGIEKKGFAAYLKHFEDLDYLRKITLDLLHDPSILKIIQNNKFEELCSRWDLKKLIKQLELETPIIRNSFCTMISAHTFDGRKGTTSLDFQNLVKFGLKPYSKKVDKFLKTKKKDETITNNIHLCDPDELIKYGCMDAITTYAQEEPNKLLLQESDNFNYCYNLLYEGSQAFADIEEEGFPIDENILDELEEFFIKEKEQRFEKLLSSSDVVKFFLKRKIKKTRTSFETFLRSPKQLQDFFFKFLNLKPLKQTKTGDSTDVEVITYLALQGSTFCETLLDIRKLNKAMDYVKQFRKYLCKDGKIHVSLNLHTVESGRVSATDPALQTIPKHGNIIEGVPYTILRKPFVC